MTPGNKDDTALFVAVIAAIVSIISLIINLLTQRRIESRTYSTKEP